MAFVEQLGYDCWSVVCVACCHMALAFAIVCSCHFFSIVFVHPFYMKFFNLVSTNKMKSP